MENEDQEKLIAEYEAAELIASPLIQEQIKIASAALVEAERIADQYGMVIESSPISPLDNTYVSPLFFEKYQEIAEDLDIYTGEYDGAGWEHSMFC